MATMSVEVWDGTNWVPITSLSKEILYEDGIPSEDIITDKTKIYFDTANTNSQTNSELAEDIYFCV